jgi:hypothetical protein
MTLSLAFMHNGNSTQLLIIPVIFWAMTPSMLYVSNSILGHMLPPYLGFMQAQALYLMLVTVTDWIVSRLRRC